MASSVRSSRGSHPRIHSFPDEVMIDDWPIRDRPLSSSLAMTLAAGASWLAVWATDNPAIGGIVAILLALTLWRTWLPVRYQLASEGVVQSLFGWRRRIAWSSIRSYELHAEGVLLSPDAAAHLLAPLRGLYLPWGTKRAAVIAQLDYHLPSNHRPIAGSTQSAAAAAAHEPADSER